MSIYLGDTPLTGGGTVDQTYDATSTNAQSGTAVAGLLETIYPVGSVYITTSSTCPLSALISGSTWTLVSSGRVLQGADSGHSAGTTIEAGLPNITGSVETTHATRGMLWEKFNTSGAFTQSDQKGYWDNDTVTQQNVTSKGLYFNAQNSDSIYGNSDTVQPPAYVVNIWKRTA